MIFVFVCLLFARWQCLHFFIFHFLPSCFSILSNRLDFHSHHVFFAALLKSSFVADVVDVVGIVDVADVVVFAVIMST